MLDTLTDEVVVFNKNRYFAQIDFEGDPDLKESVSEVVDQAKDVVEAAKGKKRRGRPKKK